MRDGGTIPGTPEYARLIGAWLDDFASRGVTGVGFGYVLLRRPLAGAPTLSRYERVAGGGESAFARTSRRAWRTTTAPPSWTTRGWHPLFCRVAPDVTEARHHRPGEESPSVIELRQGGGFARTLDVDSALAAIVGACDGDLPVGSLVDAIAQLLDVDAAELRADVLPRVRELVVTGFLTFRGRVRPAGRRRRAVRVFWTPRPGDGARRHTGPRRVGAPG